MEEARQKWIMTKFELGGGVVAEEALVDLDARAGEEGARAWATVEAWLWGSMLGMDGRRALGWGLLDLWHAKPE